MKNSFNFFSSTTGIVVTGLILGLIAVFLQFSGNPGNMGICVVCFNRDIAGALGLHRAPIVQYLRPEIIGMGLGAFAAALLSGEFRARGGSAPFVRFLLGMIAAIGALVFLGCPWRVIMRLAGGDGNALFGLAGLICGVGIGTIFFRQGFSLGRSQKQSPVAGLALPLVLLGLLALALNAVFGGFKPGFTGQPIAHTESLWNFLGMVTAGLAFALAGGCPGRQLFMAGEGDNDAAIFVAGLLIGAAFAHNFGMASSGAGIGPNGAAAAIGGLVICLIIGVFNCKRGA